MAVRSRRYDGAVFEPRATVFAVTTENHQVILETDDWVEAQAAAIKRPWGTLRHVRGVHPSHVWDSDRSTQLTSYFGNCRRCTRCGAWDNGSYGSQGPCGYNWDAALVAVIERELGAREAAKILARGVANIGDVDLEEITALLTPEAS